MNLISSRHKGKKRLEKTKQKNTKKRVGKRNVTFIICNVTFLI